MGKLSRRGKGRVYPRRNVKHIPNEASPMLALEMCVRKGQTTPRWKCRFSRSMKAEEQGKLVGHGEAQVGSSEHDFTGTSTRLRALVLYSQ